MNRCCLAGFRKRVKHMKEYSDDKKTRILNAAAELFAEKPFHKVLLDHVARAAGVGKGTLYLYFKSKDELFLAVLLREFSALIDSLEVYLHENGDDPEAQITGVIDRLIKHLYDNAVFFELLRGAILKLPENDMWREKRSRLRKVMENVIRNGVEKGVFADSNPAITAQYIPGIIRSVCLHRPDGLNRDEFFRHARNFVLKALQVR